MKISAIIANPKANWGKSDKTISGVISRLSADHIPYKLYRTKHPAHASAIARKCADEDIDNVIVIGGDGTINEVIRGFLDSGVKKLPILGIIPCGSSNDFSKSLCLPQKMDASLQLIKQGFSRAIDIGKCGNNYFCMASCIGLFADIARQSNKLTGLNGKTRYIAGTLLAIFNIKHGWDISIKAKNTSINKKCGTFLVANTPRFGGLNILSKAKTDDGLFDCLLIDMLGKLEAVKLIPLALSKKLMQHPKVTYFTASQISLTVSPATYLDNDGEVKNKMITEINFNILPKRLNVFCKP